MEGAKHMNDEPLVRAHDALVFLGAVKMLPLSSFEMSIAIGAAETWASGERPTDAAVARLLNTTEGVVGPVLARLLHLGPAWKQRT